MTKQEWTKTGTLENGDYVFWETKKRSKVYKGQPDKRMILQKHPLNKNMWTIQQGQAVINMPKFKTRTQAFRFAQDYMIRN